MGVLASGRKRIKGALAGHKTEEPKLSTSEIRKKLSLLLERFDFDDKELLAKRIAEVLELESSGDLLERGRDVLGEDMTESAEFRLQILAQIAKDRDVTEPEDPFPDDFGAPKTGL